MLDIIGQFNPENIVDSIDELNIDEDEKNQQSNGLSRSLKLKIDK
jgi:hypothetical protein